MGLFHFGEAAAKSPQTNPTKLARLARSSNPVIVELVAANPSTPQGSLDSLAKSGSSKSVLAVARNRSTSSATLKELSANRDQAVRSAVASNTQTSADVLEELARARNVSDQIKLSIAMNPATPGRLLSDLVSSRASPDHVKMAVAGNPSTPPQTLDRLLDTSRTTSAMNRILAENPATSTQTRAFLFGVGKFRETVVRTSPQETTAARIAITRREQSAGRPVLNLLALDLDPSVRRAVAVAPLADAAVLETLARDNEPSVSTAARARTTSDHSELVRLIETGDPTILEALARNPHTQSEATPAIARALLNVGDSVALLLLARDVSAPHDVLEVLAVSADSAVRYATAINPSAPENVLRTLAKDAETRIRVVAARSSMLPLDSLVVLASDAEPTVRAAVAANPITPAEILLRLASDETPAVAEEVAGHATATSAVLQRVAESQLEKRKDQLSKSGSRQAQPEFPLGALTAVAASSATPPEILRAISSSVDQVRRSLPTYGREFERALEREERVWIGIAANSSTPADLLDQLARMVHKEVWVKSDPDRGSRGREGLREAILSMVVHNPATPIATVEFLSQGDWVARRTTTRSEREDGHTTTWTIWDGSATSAAKEDMARSVRAEMSRRRWQADGHASPLVFANDHDVSPEILDELANDHNESVRQAVAANRSTTSEAFARLARDPARQVRLAAAGASHPDKAAAKYDHYSQRPRRESFYREAFETLADDEDAGVRAAVVSNPAAWSAISTASRSKRSFDADPAVRSALVATLSADDSWSDGLGLSKDALLHLVETGTTEIWRLLASRYRLPQNVVKRVLETGDSESAVLIATNTSATELLVQLAGSDDLKVVDAVAERRFYGPEETKTKVAVAAALIQNSLTPSSFINRAAYDEADDQSLDLLLQHPNISEELLMQFATGSDERKLRAVSRANHAGPKRAVAENAATPSDLLESLALDADQAVREALLINPSTPPTVLVQLIRRGEE
ncbi:hypothetical protein BH09ACT1_BH09ACT1_12690 [soil metagenome]